MTTPVKDTEKVFLNLIVGITGHRDIVEEDKDILKKSIREVFERLREKCPDTPLILLTPLAEGADRLAADVALEDGIKYIVPLPLPIEEYKKDFPDTVDEFKKYLSKSFGYFELPIDEKNKEAVKKYGPERDKRYELVGAFIVRFSQVLIALWDGKDSGLTGGTSQIVNFQLNGLPSEHAPNRTSLDLPDKGPLYHVPTRRKKGFDPSVPYSSEIEVRTPESKKKEDDYFAKGKMPWYISWWFNDKQDGMFWKFNKFNAEVNNLSLDDIKESRKNLASPEALGKENYMSILYSEADALALKHQKMWHFSQKILFGLAGFVALVFVLYTVLNILPLFIVYFLLYIAIAFLFLFFHKNRESYIDFRSLAEGLRTEFFLRLAGIHVDAADQYLRKHAEELQWIREAMRVANVFDPQKEPALNLVLDDWIKGQGNYFNKSAVREKKKLRILRATSVVLFILGLLSAIFVIVITVSHLFAPLPVLAAMILLLPLFGGLLETYAHRMALSEHVGEYSRMRTIFERAEEKWRDNNIKNNQEIISELGKEALRENADWLLLHRKLPDGMPR